PGAAITIFCPAATAGLDARAAAPHSSAAMRVALPIISSSHSATSPFLLRSELELGRARLGHQGGPDVLAQLGETRLAQRLARARTRQVDRDHLMDAARTSLEHDDAVAEQYRLLDRVGDEQHRGRALLPDAQEFELQDLSRLRV